VRLLTAQPLRRHLSAHGEVERRERGQAAQCSHPLVRQHAPALVLQRRHRREPQHQHAHGLVGGLPSQHQPPHQRIVYSLTSSAYQPHRGRGLREPKASSSSRLQQLQHLRQQLIRQLRLPALRHRLPPPLRSQHRGYWDGEAARRVSVPPSARDGEGARTPRCPRCVVGVSHRRVGGQTPPIECGATTTRRYTPCCCQLCTLWHCTHPAKHRPLQAGSAQRVQTGTTLRSSSALQRERRFLRTTVLVQQ
jgi:hypothetical protein